MCFIINRFRVKKFTLFDQLILGYGGLRGAIAYGLVMAVADGIPAKNIFVTTCLIVIFFTVFIQVRYLCLIHDAPGKILKSFNFQLRSDYKLRIYLKM
jgi:NhaP-type Na+/H+ or K+/H+ antiporter